jgi:ankyrin repeat protein
MASNSQDTCIDAYPQAIVSNCDELSGLDSFNVAQKQLLQAICDGASDADLRSHLHSTLLKITDGANEEEGDFAEFSWKERENGKVRPGPESPDMLARGRVYEKALGEARHNPRIEKFLVMELGKDANLTDYLSLNLQEVRRLKIACWAATCNFAHMVMALIHWRDEGDRGFFYRVLTIAVEFGYVELVKRLTELDGFDVNRGRRIEDFDDIHLREVGEHIPRTVYESGYLYYYAFSDRLTPLNLAAKLGNLEMVNTFLACKSKERALSPEGYWALHWAAKMGHAEVVNAILRNKDVNAAVLMSVEKSLIEDRLSNGFDTSFDWSDGADIGPFCKVFFTPLQLALLYGDKCVVELLEKRLEYDTGVTALQIAKKMTRDEMVKILAGIPEVAKDVKRLEKKQKKIVNALNTILLVAALIGSATFASGLEPPLGYSPFFGSASLHLGAPSPLGMYPSYASVEGHPKMPYFCVFNALSFVFAIATLVTGAAAARPSLTEVETEYTVLYWWWMVRIAYILLCCSVTSFVITFLTGVLIVFPPIPTYFFIYVIIYAFTALLTIIGTYRYLPYLLPVIQSLTDTVSQMVTNPVSQTVTCVRSAFVTAFGLFVDIRRYYYLWWLIFVIILVIVLFLVLIL